MAAQQPVVRPAGHGSPPFSIIIPTLDEEETIVACLTPLQSLRQQAEIVIVDGGSHDRTEELAAPLADRVLAAPRGRASQMNAGARVAHGKVLVFLHADTFLPQGALESIGKGIGHYTGWGRFDIRLEGGPAILKIVALLMNLRSRLTGIATGDQVIFVSRHLFDQVGGFPQIALMEDIALCGQLKKLGPPRCLKAKVSSSARRWRQYGVGRTILLMWWLRLRYFFGADPELLAACYRAGSFLPRGPAHQNPKPGESGPFPE